LKNVFFRDAPFVAGAGDGFQLGEGNAFACGDIEDEGRVETGVAGAICRRRRGRR